MTDRLWTFGESEATRAAYERIRSRANVGKAIINGRLDRSITQGELARIAGTTQSRISAMESLTANVRFATLERVAAALGLMVVLVPIGATDPRSGAPVPASDFSRSTPEPSAVAAASPPEGPQE